MHLLFSYAHNTKTTIQKGSTVQIKNKPILTFGHETYISAHLQV